MKLVLPYYFSAFGKVDHRSILKLEHQISAKGCEPIRLSSTTIADLHDRPIADTFIPFMLIDPSDRRLYRAARSLAVAYKSDLVFHDGPKTAIQGLNNCDHRINLMPGVTLCQLCQQIVKAIYEELGNSGLSLWLIAKKLGFSVERLQREFSRCAHLPIWNYAVQLRMFHAQRLLSFSKLPIAEVGCVLGYPDNAVFSRSFKKNLGATPRQWRTQDNQT